MPTERECADCGRTFRGVSRKCGPCWATDRKCENCGAAYRGNHAQCRTCLAIERECTECGRTFRGMTVRCFGCQATERQCVDCGRTYQGRRDKCPACCSVERECESCGRSWRGTNRKCAECRSVERECESCGRTFQGTSRKCSACWLSALPLETRQARRRTANNSRRARLIAAQIAGPVSSAEYAAILAAGPCVYCGADAEHVDHVRPLSRGGWEHPANLVPACAWCNTSKGDRLLTEWRPDRVAHGVAHSPKVSAEYNRLTSENTMREVV